MDLLDKFPHLFSLIREIDVSEEMDPISVNAKELREIYKGETQLIGLYDSSDALRKMTITSIHNSRLELMDFYLASGKLFYVTESSDSLPINLEWMKKRSYSRYIFRDNQILDYERVGYEKDLIDKAAREKIIIECMVRNIGLLKAKLTEMRK